MNKYVKVALVILLAGLVGFAGFSFLAGTNQPAAYTSTNVVEVTTQTFQKEVLESDIPVVIDFNATWCGPCKDFKPVFHKAADQYKGKVKFVSIDVDKSPEVAALFGIQAIPTVLFLKPTAEGISGGAAQGAMTAEQFQKLMDYCMQPDAKLIPIFDKRKVDAPNTDGAPKTDEAPVVDEKK